MNHYFFVIYDISIWWDICKRSKTLQSHTLTYLKTGMPAYSFQKNSSYSLYFTKQIKKKFHLVPIVFHAIGKNNNTHTVQAESSKFASVLFDQGFQIWVRRNLSKHHLTVFCIDLITPGFVVYYVNKWKYLPSLPAHKRT